MSFLNNTFSNQDSPVGGVLQHHFKTDAKMTNHLDRSSLLPFAAINGQTHLGTRDIYALAHREDVPFMIANIQGGTIEKINGDSYTFSLPTVQENSTKIVSLDVDDKSKIGYGGQPFKITLSNGKLGGTNARITPNMLLPYVLEVVNFQKKGSGHVQYTVVYKGNMKGQKSIPENVLQPNSFMYKLSSGRSSEFGQTFDSWEVSAGSERKFKSFLSTNEVNTHYHFTDQACKFSDSTRVTDKTWIKDALTSMVEYVGIKGNMDPQMKTMSQYVGAVGAEKAGSTIGFRFLTTMYDQISMKLLEKQSINQMVWDPGSVSGHDGLDQNYIHPGVWHQLDYSGYKYGFSIPSFSKETILSGIRQYRAGKQATPTYGQEPVYKIRTGDAGVELLNKIFEKEFHAQTTGVATAEALKQYEGDYLKGLEVNTPWFKSLRIAGQFKLIIERDSSLDPTSADDIHNPMVNGYRLSSYAMILEDYDTSASNIKILRNEFNNGGNMRMEVISGSRTHPLLEMTNNGIPMHQGSSLATGFGAYFRATPDTAVVWDPTNLLKFSPKNPFTGDYLL